MQSYQKIEMENDLQNECDRWSIWRYYLNSIILTALSSCMSGIVSCEQYCHREKGFYFPYFRIGYMIVTRWSHSLSQVTHTPAPSITVWFLQTVQLAFEFSMRDFFGDGVEKLVAFSRKLILRKRNEKWLVRTWNCKYYEVVKKFRAGSMRKLKLTYTVTVKCIEKGKISHP